MIHSMTGFGRGFAQTEQVAVTVEMRSVNSRFCEVIVRSPRELNPQESEIQTRVKGALARGRINVQVQVEQVLTDAAPYHVDTKRATAYGQMLEQLRTAAGITAPVTLDHLLKFSEVLQPVEASTDTEAVVWPAVEAALSEAIAGIQTMRAQEGQALQDELTARLDALESTLVLVQTHAPERITEARTRLHDRLEELLGDERIDRDRLEIEIALLADKLDITEECVRLQSHCNLFREALANEVAVGRKLNFIAQEMNREVNTIGSKANDATVARHVVQMKEELEKIREQVENVE